MRAARHIVFIGAFLLVGGCAGERPHSDARDGAASSGSGGQTGGAPPASGGASGSAGSSGSGGGVSASGGRSNSGGAPGGRGPTPNGGGTAGAGGIAATGGRGGSASGGSQAAGGASGAGGGAVGNQELCQRTGGTVVRSLCCNTVGDFPDTCLVGACSCAPSGSHEVASCQCPDFGCFRPGVGCRVCTPGLDQTCNDNPLISSTTGTCGPQGTCTCNAGHTLIAATGRCR